jgi:hypothetical protein
MKLKTLSIIVMMFLASSITYAIPYGFQNITSNNATNAAIGEAQLALDVTGGANQISFEFLNSGSQSCIITQIYLYLPSVSSYSLSFSSFQTDNPSTIKYSLGASPGHLPGGPQNPYFAASPLNPQPQNGIGPEENLSITFTILDGEFNDVLAALNSGTFIVGIHVQSFANGGSESFINDTPMAPVPEPATLILLGAGLVGLAGFGKKIKK